MPAQSYAFLSFNRGLVSRLGLARLDIDRIRISAETMRNWIPRVLGSMMLRPGLQYLGATNSNLSTRLIPFVFSNSDTAILEFTAETLRIWRNDSLITRPVVTSIVANGNFTTDLSSWTDNDETGAVSVWHSGGYMRLTGTGSAAAVRDQTISVLSDSQNIEHALRIVTDRGPVTLRVGSTVGDDDYITETELGIGVHSLTFTPTGSSFSIRFQNRRKHMGLVESCNVESAGVLSIASPYTATDVPNIRYDQSGDVVFIACDGFTQRRVERRTSTSWSIVRYEPEDGPFEIQNVTSTTLSSTGLTAQQIITASTAIFKSTHEPTTNNCGALFKLVSNGQRVTATATGENTFTSSVKITGVTTSRPFTVIATSLTGTSTQVTLQRSLETSTGPWIDVESYTTDQSKSFDDGLDNQIAWYRVGVKTGDFSSGTIGLELNYSGGSITGTFKVVSVFNNGTQAIVDVIKDLGSTNATDNWSEGSWSEAKGWPSAVAFHEGRLAWAGKDKIWLSISDAFDSFDEDTEGDSGPIARSIGQGPVDTFNWMVSSQRLLLGGQGAEFSARSSSLDEPLTPTNFNLKTPSTQGSANIQAIKIDNKVIFVQKGRTRAFELDINNDPSAINFASIDLTQLVPEVGEPAITRCVVQRQPDTRMHFIKQDGVVALLLYDKIERVLCWCEVQSDGASGIIEDVCVLPGTSVEDQVYYVVRRVVNGSTVRYLEKWALESEAKGTSLNKQADSFITYTGTATTAITGLDHLEGEEVVVWAAGADVGTATSTASSWTYTYTVSGGAITLATAATNVCVGLPYKAQWKSGKLALAAALGVPLTKRKRLHGIGTILLDTHTQGLFFGRDFANMTGLPQVRNGKPVATGVITDIDDGGISFPGEWSTDTRLCLEARAPRPCTVSAIVVDTETHEQR